MATWTVHAREDDLTAAVAGDRLRILPEGISWGAFFVPFAWAPWNGLWWVLLGWLAATGAIELIDVRVSAAAGAVLSLAFVVWFALAAHDLHRWTLERRGWRLVALIEARSAAEAEARFVEKLNAAEASTSANVLAPLPPLPAFSGGTP